ncbi:hypothetical protein [Paraburkholderia sp. RL17-337-BIB-A]|uniref:hypothetical protein n=1 Tax=Paraburkholderia sp. RL17-337-BIB-A TaxID=3031636 RepID=UPI0038BDB417
MSQDAAGARLALFAPAYSCVERFGLRAGLCALRQYLHRVEQVLLDVGTRSLPLRHPTAQYDTGIDAPTVQG